MSKSRTRNSIFNEISEIERLPIDALKVPSKPLRVYTRQVVRQASRLIAEIGMVKPIVVDQNNMILAGLLWYLAAKMLEFSDVPVVRVSHLSPAQLAAYRIGEERLTELSPWNDQVLAEELKDLCAQELDFDIGLTGFSVGEIDVRIAQLDVLESKEPSATPGNNEESIAAVEPVTKPGDLWILGRHRLLCGSSLDSETWQILMNGEAAALAFTDPPYNVPIAGHVIGNGNVRHREFTMASGEMTDEEFCGFLRRSLEVHFENSADGSLHYVCMDWRHVRQLLNIGCDVYNRLINICLWVKSNGGMGSFYRSRHELIVIFRKGTKQHNNNIQLGRFGRYRTNVWEYPGSTSLNGRATDEGDLLALHPTVKPVQLVADAILDSTTINDLVIDGFAGSGSTLVACERVRRRFFGIEIDPLYVDTAVRRWQRHSGCAAIHAISREPFEKPLNASEIRNG